MRSPAAAIAWELLQRHSWGLIAHGPLPRCPRRDQASGSGPGTARSQSMTSSVLGSR